MAKATQRSNPGLGGLSPKESVPVRAPGEIKLLKAIDELRRKLRPMADPERAMYVATRQASELFGADAHCFAVTTPGIDVADFATFTGTAQSWDRQMLAGFARGERRDPPHAIALARVKRRGRPWGVVGLRWDDADLNWEIRNGLTQYINAANDMLAEIERDRIIEVRSKIDRKIMQQLRSRDLFYQILDGLRTLIRYDHSATVLIGERDQFALEVAAEKIAWRHGKSHRVGTAFDVTESSLEGLLERGVCGYLRTGDRFAHWTAQTPADAWLEQLLRTPCTASPSEPPIGEALVAPLATRDGLRAVLVLAAIHPGQLGPYEADLITSFLPQVSISLQNSRWAEAMEAQMLETERKHAMADLARGVAHDVNNAIGATIPLVQQLRADLSAGPVEPKVLHRDLEQIERSVRVCRDIFGGMLRFARTAARPERQASIRAAVEICLMILRDSLRRRNIEVEINVAADLPLLMLNQSELEQLILNLMTNARDAMSGGAGASGGGAGGRLVVSAAIDGSVVRAEVRDNGCGIPEEHLPHVQDPFFTTKADGTGLGLSICRSIVWRSHGDLRIESEVGKGTRVLLALPTATEEQSDTKGDPIVTVPTIVVEDVVDTRTNPRGG